MSYTYNGPRFVKDCDGNIVQLNDKVEIIRGGHLGEIGYMTVIDEGDGCDDSSFGEGTSVRIDKSLKNEGCIRWCSPLGIRKVKTLKESLWTRITKLLKKK